jgi:hypothetical protein
MPFGFGFAALGLCVKREAAEIATFYRFKSSAIVANCSSAASRSAPKRMTREPYARSGERAMTSLMNHLPNYIPLAFLNQRPGFAPAETGIRRVQPFGQLLSRDNLQQGVDQPHCFGQLRAHGRRQARLLFVGRERSLRKIRQSRKDLTIESDRPPPRVQRSAAFPRAPPGRWLFFGGDAHGMNLGGFNSQARKTCNFAGLYFGPSHFIFNLEQASGAKIARKDQRVGPVPHRRAGHDDRLEAREPENFAPCPGDRLAVLLVLVPPVRFRDRLCRKAQQTPQFPVPEIKQTSTFGSAVPSVSL